VGELGILVHQHPFRERLWAFLLVALYRSGRQADALAAYQQARRLLRDELGLEPGGELQRLERAILEHDPSLSVAPAKLDTTPHLPDVRRSPVRYAETRDGTHIAYQIVGNGPIDVLAIPGFVSHLDMWWESPTDHLVTKLASFSRLILFDKRGMGLSDRPETVDVEHWVEDAAAVMGAAGSKRAVILGISAGVPTALLFAATFPQRVRSLVLYGGFARLLAGDGNEFGHDPAGVAGYIKHMEAKWGTGVGISNLAPSRTFDPIARDYWARIQTRSASPAAAARFLRALADIDVRDVLPSISSPTLILHATRDQNVPVGAARAMRDEIEGAQLVELDSDIHLIWLSDVIDEATRHIESFISRVADAQPLIELVR
jgi:pimeloyl-ACP methyl ester carboxylesterase